MSVYEDREVNAKYISPVDSNETKITTFQDVEDGIDIKIYVIRLGAVSSLVEGQDLNQLRANISNVADGVLKEGGRIVLEDNTTYEIVNAPRFNRSFNMTRVFLRLVE